MLFTDVMEIRGTRHYLTFKVCIENTCEIFWSLCKGMGRLWGQKISLF